jgi:outer membrane protein assembly factor BamB
VDGDRVYTVGYWGDVGCLDAASGKVIWQKNITTDTKAALPRWGQAGSPLIEGDVMYLNIGEHGCALDKSTGRILWASGGDASGYSTPIAVVHAGRPHLAMFGAKFLHVVDAARGTVSARHPWETSYDVNAADPTPVNGRIFISSGYKKGAVLMDFNGPQPKVVWQNDTIRAQFSSAILLDGHLYACDGNTSKGDLVCMHADSGREVWREKLGFGSLIVINRSIVYFNERGDLIVAKAQPSGFDQLARADALVTGGKAWTAPSYAGGRIYLRNSKGSVACIRAAN